MNINQKSNTNFVLKVKNLGKEYKLFASPKDRIKSLFSSKIFYTSHWSLQNISFEMKKGQCMGIIGNNGAGKSTLLKLLANTLHPTTGTIDLHGRVTAILELGAGFHPDFTGRENLYFNGSLIGISQEKMKTLEPSIIEFSELGEAINRPVKTYSSGMVVRLAFSLITAVEPDLLIVDEALAVGDQSFQKKCMERIRSFQKNGCSILFCSHSLYHIRHLCDCAIWINQGKINAIGDTEHVLKAYEIYFKEKNAEENNALITPTIAHSTANEGFVGKIQSITVSNLLEGEPPRLETNDLSITVTALTTDSEPPNIALMLEQVHGVGITSVATHVDEVIPRQIGPNLWQTTLTFPDFPLHSGNYVISGYLFDSKGFIEYDKWYHCQEFSWTYQSKLPGLIKLPHYWN